MPILTLTVDTDNANDVLAAVRQLAPYTPKLVGTNKHIRRYASDRNLNVNLVMNAGLILSTAVALRWCSQNGIDIAVSPLASDKDVRTFTMRCKNRFREAMDAEGRMLYDGFYLSEIDPDYVQLAGVRFPRSGTSAKFLWGYLKFLGLKIPTQIRI